MDKQAFKYRMQNLKSYRENNPGKGYWDWKIRSFENGGEVDTFERKTRKDIARESLVDDRLDYERMFENQNQYQKDFARKWYTERAKNPKYSDQIGGDKLNTVLSSVDKATWKTPTEAMHDNLVNKGYTPTDRQIQQQLDVLKNKGTMGFANPNMYSYTSMKPFNTWHEGIGHIVGDNNPSILKANPDVYIQSNDPTYQDYINKANEKHAQTWDFRGNNQTMKDDEGNYYIDPNRQLTPEEVQEMIDKGAKIPEQWKGVVSPEEISLIHNTFADTGNKYDDNGVQYVAEGGEITRKPNTSTRTSYDRTNPYTGKPLATGIAKSVFDLEDAANLTPIGDAISINDTYQAIKQKDWEGAGLAALTMIPFVPMTVKQFRRKYKGVTPKPTVNMKVNKNATQNAINDFEREAQRRSEIINRGNNEGYRVAERLMEDPDYISRASEVYKKYGDDYLTTYADILQTYNDNPNLLPKSNLKAFPLNNPSRAAMEATYEATQRHIRGGEFPGIGEFNYRIDPSRTDLTGNVTTHEWNHYVDYLKNKSPKADANSNLFYQMSKDMDNVRIDSNDSYYKLPTEQKAYMNQIREYLFENGKINKRGDKVTQKLIKSTLNELSNNPLYDSAVRASKQFGGVSKYTKWFNSIPLLGIGAMGVNRYFNENE